MKITQYNYQPSIQCIFIALLINCKTKILEIPCFPLLCQPLYISFNVGFFTKIVLSNSHRKINYNMSTVRYKNNSQNLKSCKILFRSWLLSDWLVRTAVFFVQLYQRFAGCTDKNFILAWFKPFRYPARPIYVYV